MRLKTEEIEQKVRQAMSLIAYYKEKGETVYGTEAIYAPLGISASTFRQSKGFEKVRIAAREITKRCPARYRTDTYQAQRAREQDKEAYEPCEKIVRSLRHPLEGSTDKERWRSFAGGRPYVKPVD